MADKTDTTTTGSTAGESAIGKDTNAAKVVIKNVDMSEEQQMYAVDTAIAALEKFNMEKDIAAHIKKDFDKQYGATWHAVVGKNFGSFVTHGEYDISQSISKRRGTSVLRFIHEMLDRSSVSVHFLVMCMPLTHRRPQKRRTSFTSTSDL